MLSASSRCGQSIACHLPSRSPIRYRDGALEHISRRSTKGADAYLNLVFQLIRLLPCRLLGGLVVVVHLLVLGRHSLPGRGEQCHRGRKAIHGAQQPVGGRSLRRRLTVAMVSEAARKGIQIWCRRRMARARGAWPCGCAALPLALQLSLPAGPRGT